MEAEDKKIILNIARVSIKNYDMKDIEEYITELKQTFTYPNWMTDYMACFVTLTKSKSLRGCIGSLVSYEPLVDNLIRNSIGAAYFDPRFEKLTDEEFHEIKVEVSILSKPKDVLFIKDEELFSKIKDKGVILKKGHFTATFLPQVWEQLPNPKKFLEHLAEKAGLKFDSWKTCNYKTYEVTIIEETG